MSKKLLCAAAIALNSLVIPFAIADNTASSTPSSSNDSSQMTKDAWLNAMEPMLPGMICKGFLSDTELKKRFEDLKISYDQCVNMIPESEKKCREQIYSSIPDSINSDSAGTWGKTLGECIGKDFAEQHLIPKS